MLDLREKGFWISPHTHLLINYSSANFHDDLQVYLGGRMQS